MLVLTRMLGEKIMIGEDIVITVVQIDRGKVRLGIVAPREVPVFREELIMGNGEEVRIPWREGDVTGCKICGCRIRCMGSYWMHTDTTQRHSGSPASEYRIVKEKKGAEDQRTSAAERERSGEATAESNPDSNRPDRAGQDGPEKGH